MKLSELLQLLAVSITLITLILTTIRFSINRQFQQLKQQADTNLNNVSKKLDNLDKDFKQVFHRQDQHLHEVEKKFLGYQKQVAETYLRKDESFSKIQLLEEKLDKLIQDRPN
ncbi:hypothetical protein H0A36_18890 [Endozoicomonas sp. SM1973]|uniref:Uncharacterized protein n=1 Tax=Spartinivicinus marinus TaxID=2994442 RepID=A0A853IKA5_9GAMM|nr:hypothetical protein [Spartinivicinus marinus]MCX4029755.1 hypothetical protein [Spartinivicinus marinus]NYZ68086.1 hypothetical protein [Spartinivicinus marinus]